MTENPETIPVGLDHLLMVERLNSVLKDKTYQEMLTNKEPARLVGTALSILYQAATCQRECHGGAHILESLCGRAYNLGTSAYILCTLGFYDEALNLVRGIGEIANIVSLSVVDKDALKEWLGSDAKTRMTKFSPAKVRKLLEEKGRELMYADRDWYSQLCENYTHVHPGTAPNLHNKTNQAYVGGIFQEDGLWKAIGELATVLSFLSMIISRYFKFDDLFELLNSQIKGAGLKNRTES